MAAAAAPNPFDQFDSPDSGATAAAPAAPVNPFDQFDAPANAPSKQTAAGAGQAIGSGLTEGAADIAGLPVDTARKAVEIGKAAAGTAIGEATKTESIPSGETLSPDQASTRTSHGMYHYINPSTGADTFSQTPPPAGSKPFTHVNISVPSFLQPGPDQPDIGGSESIKSGIQSVLPGAVGVQQQTPVNRVLHAGAQAVPNAVFAPEAPVTGALSAAAGGATSQTVKEAGGSPLAQTLSGLAAGAVVPLGAAGGAAAVRGAVRGGEEGRAATEANIANAAEANTSISTGQATGNKFIQAMEGTSSKLWGGAPIKALAASQNEEVGGRVGQIVDNLRGDATASPTGAGTAIREGVGTSNTPGTGLGDMRAAERAAYDKRDALVPKDYPVNISGTLGKLNELTAPTPGAEATTAALVSPKIAAVRNNLLTDVTPPAPPMPSDAPPYIAEPGTFPAPPSPAISVNGPTSTGAAANPQMPYSAALALRTRLSGDIDWNPLNSDTANGQLKLVHSALGNDITSAAQAASPEAAAAAKAADALYAQNSAPRKMLQRIVSKNGGPEDIYQAATNGTQQGATKIGTVMSALQPEQQNVVRASILDRLGRSTPSTQNDMGSNFSLDTFLTNWAKIKPEAKDAVFGASGPANTLRASLDSIASTASDIRDSTLFKNPGGTGEAAGHMGGAIAVFEGLRGLLAGHPAALAATVGGVAANHILARTLTNPGTAAWLAQSTKAPTAMLPSLFNQLNQMGKTNPDAKALHDALTSTGQ